MSPDRSRPAGAPLPPGTCDSHLHVIGESLRYPFDDRRNYTPQPAALTEYRRVAAACGIDRAVLVQPSVYGTDNACLLDALRAASPDSRASTPREEPAFAPELRGVVVPAGNTGDGALEAMHALGVRGVRLNLVNPQVLSVGDALALVARMRHRSWHLQVQLRLDAEGDAQLVALARDGSAAVVVDHFGRPPPGRLSHGHFSPVLLELAAAGRVWVKLSAPYRVGSEPGHGDLRAWIDALIEAAPTQLLWGSDWPHTELTGELPKIDDLIGLLADWLPDAGLHRRVCVDNPDRLYDFHDSTGISP